MILRSHEVQVREMTAQARTQMKLLYAVLLIAFLFGTITFSTSARQTPTATAEWRASQDTDYRGTAYNQFSLTGKFIKEPRGGSPDPPSLEVRCKAPKSGGPAGGKFQSATIRIGVPVKVDWVEPEVIHGTSYFPKVTVRYRLDEGKERREQWSPGNEKWSASIPKNSMKLLLRGRSVLLTVADPSGTDVVFQFDFSDPAQVENACNLGHHQR
jgi:hypothetical protein